VTEERVQRRIFANSPLLPVNAIVVREFNLNVILAADATLSPELIHLGSLDHTVSPSSTFNASL
jgi:hypothetical protein